MRGTEEVLRLRCTAPKAFHVTAEQHESIPNAQTDARLARFSAPAHQKLAAQSDMSGGGENAFKLNFCLRLIPSLQDARPKEIKDTN